MSTSDITDSIKNTRRNIEASLNKSSIEFNVFWGLVTVIYAILGNILYFNFSPNSDIFKYAYHIVLLILCLLNFKSIKEYFSFSINLFEIVSIKLFKIANNPLINLFILLFISATIYFVSLFTYFMVLSFGGLALAHLKKITGFLIIPSLDVFSYIFSSFVEEVFILITFLFFYRLISKVSFWLRLLSSISVVTLIFGSLHYCYRGVIPAAAIGISHSWYIMNTVLFQNIWCSVFAHIVFNLFVLSENIISWHNELIIIYIFVILIIVLIRKTSQNH